MPDDISKEYFLDIIFDKSKFGWVKAEQTLCLSIFISVYPLPE